MLNVKYFNRDSEIAYQVVQDITALLRERQQKEERERAAALSAWAARALEAARLNWEEVRQRHSQTLAALYQARGLKRMQLLSEASMLLDSVERAAEALRQAEELSANSAMRLRLGSQHSGLRFVLVDFEKPEPQKSKKAALIMIAFGSFLGLLLLTTCVVGAFIPFIHEEQDVERLGLVVLGHVPPFPGWDTGTLRARQAGQRVDLGVITRRGD